MQRDLHGQNLLVLGGRSSAFQLAALAILLACFPFGCQGESADPAAVQVADTREPKEQQRSRPGVLPNGKVGPGNWRRLPAARGRPETDLSEELEALNAIGYAQGSEPAPQWTGVAQFDAARSQPGLNLYSSGHGTEAVLMDMEGNELHRWAMPFDEAFPSHPSRRNHPGRNFWRRVYLFENGDLLAIAEGIGLLKLDRNSNLLWVAANGAHHDLEVLPNGEILVLTREAGLRPVAHQGKPILEDFFVRLDADGELLQKVSLFQALERSAFRSLWRSAPKQHGDIFHTNSLSLLDGSHSELGAAFRAGNLLLSMRELNAICILDIEKAEMVWLQQGDYKSQHDPKMLPNGNLMLFDNRGNARHSRVFEFDLERKETVWSYRGDERDPFFSATCGAAQRLSNGNTLITESDGGRAFEVTAAGEIVWEFWNPERAGSDDEFIAAIFEMLRFEEMAVPSWAQIHSGSGR